VPIYRKDAVLKKLHMILASESAPKSFRFYDRLVFTALLRFGRAKSVNKIAEYLGVSWKCAADARDTLINLGLARLTKGKVIATKPEGEFEGVERYSWFYHLKNKTQWRQSFAYFKFPKPSKSCPIDFRACAVLGYVLSQSNTKAYKLSYSRISVNTGID
jgi:hypothetical protein